MILCIWWAIYIPLWSDSNLESPAGLQGQQQFTFHYGPILTRYRSSYKISKAPIYIPLWSDSNLMANFPMSLSYQFTFHYGPILTVNLNFPCFYQGEFTFHYGPILTSLSPSLFKTKFFIYIPLWSDSNAVNGPLYHTVFEIYIPLWSDSNMLEYHRRSSGVLIYIPLWSDSNLLIQSLIQLCLLDLHSTMVRF